MKPRLLFLIFSLLLAFSACGKSPEEAAREELARSGIAFAPNEFIKHAGAGNTATVELFLMAGMSPDTRSDNNVPCLVAAASAGEPRLATLLLELEGDLEQFKRFAESLHLGHTEALNTLLDYGADPNAHMKSGNTALTYAAFRGNLENVKVLINEGADVNARGELGGTPLAYAAELGHAEIVRVLLDNGADPNIRMDGGGTALTNAAMHGYVEIVRALLEKGTQVNVKTKHGLTALFGAKRMGHTEVVELLEEAGAIE